MNQRDYSLQWDFDHVAFDKALEEGRPIHSLCITEEFLQTAKYRPSHPRMEKIFAKISEMWTLEALYLAFQSTLCPGRILSLALSPGLQILKVHSGLELSSHQDVLALANTLKQNGLSLKQISLLNIQIKLNPLTRVGWGGSTSPLLDPLLESVSDMQFMEIFEITLHESQRNAKGQAHVSIDSLVPVCSAQSLKRLNLSNLGLEDNHLIKIAQVISQNPLVLKELILNENFNTELGLDMIITLLLDAEKTSLQIFQAFQNETRVSSKLASKMCQVLETKNTVLTNIRIHTITTEETTALEFYCRLNQAGRHLFLENSMTIDQWITLFEGVNDDHEMIFYCLKQSSFWWKYLGLGRSLSRPLESTAKSLSFQVEEFKSNDASGDKIHTKTSARLKKQLRILGIPSELRLSDNDDNISISSNQSDSYLDDLHKQKEYLLEDIREEALEEAHALYQKKIRGGQEDEKLFLQIFKKKLEQRKNKTKPLLNNIEEDIQKEMARVVATTEMEKEVWIKEQMAVKRRIREVEREAAEEKKIAETAAPFQQGEKRIQDLERLQAEASALKEEWKQARQRSRSAKNDLKGKLNLEEEALFEKWVEKRQQVKDAEAELESNKVKTGVADDPVWESLAEIEKENFK